MFTIILINNQNTSLHNDVEIKANQAIQPFFPSLSLFNSEISFTTLNA
jgi:hypothetical protein